MWTIKIILVFIEAVSIGDNIHCVPWWAIITPCHRRGDIHQYLLIPCLPCPGPHWPHINTVTCSPQHVGHLHNYAVLYFKKRKMLFHLNFAFLLVLSAGCSFTASDQDNCFSLFWVHFFISMSWGSSALCPTAPLQITTSCTRNVVKLTYFTKHS